MPNVTINLTDMAVTFGRSIVSIKCLEFYGRVGKGMVPFFSLTIARLCCFSLKHSMLAKCWGPVSNAAKNINWCFETQRIAQSVNATAPSDRCGYCVTLRDPGVLVSTSLPGEGLCHADTTQSLNLLKSSLRPDRAFALKSGA
jgi:hypothetical protein